MKNEITKSNSEKKEIKTHAIGDAVTVKWATHSSYEYEYERGIVVGAFLNNSNVLIYMVRIGQETKKVPHYQIND